MAYLEIVQMVPSSQGHLLLGFELFVAINVIKGGNEQVFSIEFLIDFR